MFPFTGRESKGRYGFRDVLLGDFLLSYIRISSKEAKKAELGAGGLGGGPRPMLLWYVWIRLVDGAWHKLDDIAKQLRIPRNSIQWAAKYLTDKGMTELGIKEDEIRLHKGNSRLEDVVKGLSDSSSPSL